MVAAQKNSDCFYDMYKMDESLGAKYFGFFSPLVPSKREKNVLVFLSLYVHFLREVFAFQFLNDKIHNNVFFDIIVNPIIQN